jgi:hypothetical protein
MPHVPDTRVTDAGARTEGRDQPPVKFGFWTGTAILSAVFILLMLFALVISGSHGGGGFGGGHLQIIH